MVTAIEPKTFGKFTPDADAEIRAAAKRYNLDPKFLRAIIAAESHGDWEYDNRCVYVGFKDQYIYPYIGLFEDAAASHGINFDVLDGNRMNQIFAVARILSDLKYGVLSESRHELDDYVTAEMWYCGRETGSEESRRNPDYYANRIIQWMEQMGDF